VRALSAAGGGRGRYPGVSLRSTPRLRAVEAFSLPESGLRWLARPERLAATPATVVRTKCGRRGGAKSVTVSRFGGSGQDTGGSGRPV